MIDLFPRGIVCRRATRLAAEADALWRIVGNVGSADLAAEFIERIEMTGAGTGAIRMLHLRNGAVVKERIEEYSSDDRYYVYRGLDPGPFEFTHYLAMASVVPAGPYECIFSWITTATAVDGREEETRRLLDGNILSIFAAARSLLGVT
jgi:hypothetical protein